jgi:hypothetical protein
MPRHRATRAISRCVERPGTDRDSVAAPAALQLCEELVGSSPSGRRHAPGVPAVRPSDVRHWRTRAAARRPQTTAGAAGGDVTQARGGDRAGVGLSRSGRAPPRARCAGMVACGWPRGLLPLLPPHLGSLHVRARVNMLGSELIVRSAEQPQVVGFGAAAFARGLAVVELEPGPAAAAHAVSVGPAAAEPLAFEHHAACGARNVRTARGWCSGRDCGRRILGTRSRLWARAFGTRSRAGPAASRSSSRIPTAIRLNFTRRPENELEGILCIFCRPV